GQAAITDVRAQSPVCVAVACSIAARSRPRLSPNARDSDANTLLLIKISNKIPELGFRELGIYQPFSDIKFTIDVFKRQSTQNGFLLWRQLDFRQPSSKLVNITIKRFDLC